MPTFCCEFTKLIQLSLTAISTFARFVSASGLDFNLVGKSFGISGANATFDYVIVGGGTAGLTLATRLAQNASNSVAVVEAGGFYETDNGNISTVPSTDTYFAGADPGDTQPLIDWGFVTVPQDAMNNRKLHYARGKCLGGSSARNYFAYQRGTVDSYHMWAEQVEDPSYEFESFLPYFQKSTNFTPANMHLRATNASAAYNTSSFSPDGGPLHVSYPNWANPFSSWVKEGLQYIGIFPAVDFVSGYLSGAQYNMQTIDPTDETRSSSESSYLRLALSTTNLVIYKNTVADRILFDDKKASDLLVNTAGTTYRLSADKEIIVSAGTFQSPQLLMVSGIGPAATLQHHGIDVISDLSGVGQNMWDHLMFGPSYQVSLQTHSALNNATFRAMATEDYLEHQSGPVGNSGGDILAWEKLPSPERDTLSNATKSALAGFPQDWPEIEYLFFDAYIGQQLNYVTASPDTSFQYVAPVAALVAPLSRGNVTISSGDMADPPIINPNWIAHPADQELAVAAYKRVRQLMDTEIIRDITIGDELYPGRNITSDRDILEVIKESGITVYHASSTCKMGKSSDPMAVVDAQGRVFGVDGLRVVDVSAFPFLPPGHPQSTCYALAEKVADSIMKD